MIFFFNDTATTEIYTLSLHDALPISRRQRRRRQDATAARRRGDCLVCETQQANLRVDRAGPPRSRAADACPHRVLPAAGTRSEEHTSELQSRQYLVCRLLLEKKKKYP